MSDLPRLELAGQRFVVLEEDEYARLCQQAAQAAELSGAALPSFPQADKQGRVSAVEYARVSLARDVVRDRRAAGLTQAELAKLAGTRQETISRLENGRVSVSPKLVDKIDVALKRALAARARRRRG